MKNVLTICFVLFGHFLIAQEVHDYLRIDWNEAMRNITVTSNVEAEKYFKLRDLEVEVEKDWAYVITMVQEYEQQGWEVVNYGNNGHLWIMRKRK